jgi:hypothetical protein
MMARNVMAMDAEWWAKGPSAWVSPGELEVAIQLNIVRSVK